MSKEAPSKDETAKNTKPTAQSKGSKPSTKAMIKPTPSAFEEMDKLADESDGSSAATDIDDSSKPSNPVKPKVKSIGKKANEEEPVRFIAIRSAKAPKVSPKSEGELHYELGEDADKIPAIRITHNTSGGYFSKEWLLLEEIKGCLQGHLGTDTPFNSTVFKPIFRNSSANNGGFLAATLRAEGLLKAVDVKPFQHFVDADWDEWLKTCIEKK